MGNKRQVNTERRGDRLDRQSSIVAAMDAIGPEKAAAVRAQAARTVASQPELYAGVPEEVVVMAVLVAGHDDLCRGLSADAAAKFDKAVDSIDKAGDAKFHELVAKLRSPDDQRAVTEAYEKAKADAQREKRPFTPIITDDAEHLVIADPLRQGVPGQRFDVRPGGRLSRKAGRLAVVPPSDGEQAKGLLEVSALVRRHPFSAIPEPIWRQVIAAVNRPGIRQLYGLPGALRNGFDLSKGAEPGNVAALCQAGEKLIGPHMFANAQGGDPDPGTAGASMLAARWVDFQNQASATSLTVELRRRLAETEDGSGGGGGKAKPAA